MKNYFVYVAPNGTKYYGLTEEDLIPMRDLFQAHQMSAEDRIRDGEAGPVAQLGQSFIDGCAPIVKWITIAMILLFAAIWAAHNVPFLRGY